MNNYKIVLEDGTEVNIGTKELLFQKSPYQVLFGKGSLMFEVPIKYISNLPNINIKVDDSSKIESTKEDNSAPNSIESKKQAISSCPESFIPLYYEKLYITALMNDMIREAETIKSIAKSRRRYDKRFVDCIVFNSDIDAIKQIHRIVENMKSVLGSYWSI